MKTLLLSLLLISSLARAEGPTCAGVFAPLHQFLNPSAAQSAERYAYPNYRAWSDYRYLLGGVRTPAAGSRVLDLGGGRGNAMKDLAALGVDATVLNTQTFSARDVRFIQGWAEEVLPTLKSGSYEAVYDVYGAFHYTPHKDLLLEETFRLLKPGGSARFVFDFAKAPTAVDGVRLDQWLIANFPGVFSVKTVWVNDLEVKVLILRKPAGRWWQRAPLEKLELGLKIARADANPRLKSIVPRVSFTAR